MQSRPDASKPVVENQTRSVGEVFVTSIDVAAITTAMFVPLDMLMHRAHAGAMSANPTAGFSNIKSPMFVAAAAINAGLRQFPILYGNSIRNGTTKITLKHSSEAVSGKHEGTKPKEEQARTEETARVEDADDVMMAKNEQDSSAWNAALPYVTSGAFGVIETLFTQSLAVKNVFAKEEARAAMNGLEYKAPTWEAGMKGFCQRTSLAFLPRAARNAASLVAFPANGFFKNVYINAGYNDQNAKFLAIGSVAGSFGLGINVFDLIFVSQALSGKSTVATVAAIFAKNGAKGFLAGAATSAVYTGFASWMVPEMEDFVVAKVLPVQQRLGRETRDANYALHESDVASDEQQYQNLVGLVSKVRGVASRSAVTTASASSVTLEPVVGNEEMLVLDTSKKKSVFQSSSVLFSSRPLSAEQQHQVEELLLSQGNSI
jgi:hypothetical protein